VQEAEISSGHLDAIPFAAADAAEKVYAGTQRMAFELLRIPLFTFVSRRDKLLAHVPGIRFACSTVQHSIVATSPRRFFPADFQEAALDRRTKKYI